MGYRAVGLGIVFNMVFDCECKGVVGCTGKIGSRNLVEKIVDLKGEKLRRGILILF
jgi:hypothetical protein